MLLGLLVSVQSFGQTKMIAFKSHSGNLSNFYSALKDPKMDLASHNLGMAPNPIVKTAQLDSVIFVSDSDAVMVTSEYCQKNEWYDRGKKDGEPNPKKFWKAGKDTVINHPLFSHQHALDSIKAEMSNHYFWTNKMDSTVFIGYDNANHYIDDDKDGQNDHDQNIAPIIGVPSEPSGGLTLMLIAIAFISLFIGFASWMLSKKSKQTLLQA